MPARIGVVVFPGSNCDRDTMHALALAGAEPVELWHERADLAGIDGVILPGGFAYGDYLRAGVIARFSPVVRAITDFAAGGGLVLGICNGFQVLAEAGLVPGALLRNRGLRFLGGDVHIATERLDTPFTALVGDRRPLRMPIAHGEGCYFADEATLDGLERDGLVLFRYVRADGSPAARGVTGTAPRGAAVTPAHRAAVNAGDAPDEGAPDRANPNGSLRAIAGVMNAAGNVAGLMPHPERASELVLGSEDGLGIVRSFVDAAALRASGRAVALAAPGGRG